MNVAIHPLPDILKLKSEPFVDETTCIEKAKKDINYFKLLYEKYYESIFLFVYNRTGEKDLAKDITADIFLKAMLKISGYKHKELPFSSWLYSIARNHLTDLFRKNKNIRIVNINTIQLNSLIQEIEINHLEQYQDRLAQLISKLEEDELLLIEMRFFEEKSFKEIAEIVSATEASVKMKMYRLLEKLKKQILNN